MLGWKRAVCLILTNITRYFAALELYLTRNNRAGSSCC